MKAMKTLRETLTFIESKIMPINRIDHRFRLEHMTFGFDGISLQAKLITSTNEDYSIQCNYSYGEKKFTEWIMLDAFGAEYQVMGIVSKTLYYFTRKCTSSIIETLGYEITD
jgi:hypothetical protein